MCMGVHWALRTIRSTVIALFANYTLTAPAPLPPFRMRMSLALLPADPVRLRFTPRAALVAMVS